VNKQAIRFTLERDIDVAGVSGTGTVASGVVWHDGTCAMRWDTAYTSVAIYDSLESIAFIHGHDGKTRIEFPESDARSVRAAYCQDLMETGLPLALFKDHPSHHMGSPMEAAIYRRMWLNWVAKLKQDKFKTLVSNGRAYKFDGMVFSLGEDK